MGVSNVKELTGYLIDRVTGAGISGKNVSFNKLDGTPVSVSDTLWQQVSGTTDANGRFSARFELSPGPVNVQVDVSGSEKKVRKSDDKAQMGISWSNDISRIARGLGTGVVGGFLNELVVTANTGHTMFIGTGAAIFNGGVFSIEVNPISVVIPENTNPALTPRIDLITLRQYNESAAGQLSGKQEIIVTLGTTSGVAPATPTGASFVDFPLATVSTSYNSATTSPGKDLRVMTRSTAPTPNLSPLFAQKFIGDYTEDNTQIPGIEITDQRDINYDPYKEFVWSETGVGPVSIPVLEKSYTYDGWIDIQARLSVDDRFPGIAISHLIIPQGVGVPASYGRVVDNLLGDSVSMQVAPEIVSYVRREGDAVNIGHDRAWTIHWRVPILGLTGVSSLSWTPRVVIGYSNDNANDLYTTQMSRAYASIYIAPRARL